MSYRTGTLNNIATINEFMGNFLWTKSEEMLVFRKHYWPDSNLHWLTNFVLPSLRIWCRTIIFMISKKGSTHSRPNRTDNSQTRKLRITLYLKTQTIITLCYPKSLNNQLRKNSHGKSNNENFNIKYLPTILNCLSNKSLLMLFEISFLDVWKFPKTVY
jgi:hypothetical protein